MCGPHPHAHFLWRIWVHLHQHFLIKLSITYLIWSNVRPSIKAKYPMLHQTTTPITFSTRPKLSVHYGSRHRSPRAGSSALRSPVCSPVRLIINHRANPEQKSRASYTRVNCERQDIHLKHNITILMLIWDFDLWAENDQRHTWLYVDLE